MSKDLLQLRTGSGKMLTPPAATPESKKCRGRLATYLEWDASDSAYILLAEGEPFLRGNCTSRQPKLLNKITTNFEMVCNLTRPNLAVPANSCFFTLTGLELCTLDGWPL